MKYHILNGDALLDQFPEDISGEKLVARECLVDGNVEGDSIKELFKTRDKYICETYEGYSAGDYAEKSVPDFEKITKIPVGAEVNLWFEDDLFCQVNFWFVLYLLDEQNVQGEINLIRPSGNIQFGFGGMSPLELRDAYGLRKEICQPQLGVLRKFWRLYQKRAHKEMLKLAETLGKEYDFVKEAVEADLNRVPTNEKLGRPKQVLIDIMSDLDTADFGSVFQEFCRREPIYGFGDLQVKRLFDEVRNHH